MSNEGVTSFSRMLHSFQNLVSSPAQLLLPISRWGAGSVSLTRGCADVQVQAMMHAIDLSGFKEVTFQFCNVHTKGGLLSKDLPMVTRRAPGKFHHFREDGNL